MDLESVYDSLVIEDFRQPRGIERKAIPVAHVPIHGEILPRIAHALVDRRPKKAICSQPILNSEIQSKHDPPDALISKRFPILAPAAWVADRG
jgi:hypothetical protein